MTYSTEDEVYEECGMDNATIASLTKKNTGQVSTLVLRYIQSGDMKIKRLLKVPISIRKEEHIFQENKTVELGPYEDSLEFFGTWNPIDCVEEVYAIYLNGRRCKLPYPKDCDSEFTENITNMTIGSNCILTKEGSTIKCGIASIKAVFSGAGSFHFPKLMNLSKRIYPWRFIGFWGRVSDPTTTFTITLEDKDGNVETGTFTFDFANTWQIISLDMDAFIGSINWQDVDLQKITISVDKACTFYLDNFNFNDGIFWTTPEGLICWSDPNTDPLAKFEVTYSYDPYANDVPEDLAEASAKMAAIKILDYCLGARQRYIAFKQAAEDMDKTPDKESMEVVRGRLKREVMEILGGIGFGTNESIGAP